ncbi:MAG TPA: hypothetical protein VK078_06980 [Pseudogracilibacillus sp.]|nr:hypothetical protein [Pseudogracilibacillus sp.]
MTIIDMEAARKWRKLSKEIQQRFIHNVFCSNCMDTTIVDYSIRNQENGVLLQGKCKTCHQDIARLIEDID